MQSPESQLRRARALAGFLATRNQKTTEFDDSEAIAKQNEVFTREDSLIMMSEVVRIR